MEFKRQFMYIAQKCLRPPAITGNKELVDVVKQLTWLSHFSFLLVTSQKHGKGCHTCVTSQIR